MRSVNAVGTVLLAVIRSASGAHAQAPAGSAPAPKEQEYEGVTVNTSFQGSADSDSHVYEWVTTAGYIFNRHFSADFGLPVLFIGGATSTGTTTSSSGLGDVFGRAKFAFRNPIVNYGTILTTALPTGDSSKGLSTGRVTFDWTNQFATGFGRFTPFVSAGVGNSLLDSRYWHRPFVTLGRLAHFEGGTSFDVARSITLGPSLYSVVPWGDQKVYSRVVPKAQGSGGTAGHGRVFQSSPVTAGGSVIDRDNGFNADLDFNPTKFVDFDLGYTHSVHYQLDTISFGISFNLTPLLRERGSR